MRLLKTIDRMNKIPMTVDGHKALDEEMKHLKTVERPAVIAAIAEAREHGDLSENAEYHAAKERQGWIEGRLAELEDKLARAQVIDVDQDGWRYRAFRRHSHRC